MVQPGQKPPWSPLADLSSVGFAMVLATVIGLAGGYYLDQWLGSEPWLLLVGLGFGIAAGFVIFFRSVNREP
jgi:ATP synthase protein I